MGKYEFIGIVALLVVVVALPAYALLEPYRLDRVQVELRQQYLVGSTDLYLDNCATCHGVAGAGRGAMPALNTLGAGGANPDLLQRIIAHSPHGTVMAAWHVDEGGVLNDYQVEGLVTFILHTDWPQVGEVAAQRGMVIPTPSATDLDMAILEAESEEDPHECRSCHEEPDVHAERFGLNCSRCHTLTYWKPALLLRHTFLLDHGGEGAVACQTCHTQSYAEHTCYECHDHQPEGMQRAHYQEEIFEFDVCAECHPTGQEGEAARLGYGLSGQRYMEERSEVEDAGHEAAGPHGDGGSGQPNLGEFLWDEERGEWVVGEPPDAPGTGQETQGDTREGREDTGAHRTSEGGNPASAPASEKKH